MKKEKLFFAFAAIGIVGVNLYVGINTPEKSEDLTLENIEVVGLSASETRCDASNQNPCEISGVGKATGKLIFDN